MADFAKEKVERRMKSEKKEKKENLERSKSLNIKVEPE